ncbi:methyltransferase domain-containing protein [Streptomyces sp. PmtG]
MDPAALAAAPRPAPTDAPTDAPTAPAAPAPPDAPACDRVERILGARYAARRHRATARALGRHLEPESWLDVGTGGGGLPAAARDVLPYTAYDGIDTGAAVEDARAAGHIEEAHRGSLTGLAPRLAGRYDAVSMVHQLERAADPGAALAAAHAVLRPGGHLLIEAADPECRSAALLGPWWVAHPHRPRLLPLARLRRVLGELGFTVVDVERRAAHLPYDLAGAVVLALHRFGPKAARSRGAAPLVAAARALDHALAPLLVRTGFANTYRVIARREADA